jgi:hypothetical protein
MKNPFISGGSSSGDPLALQAAVLQRLRVQEFQAAGAAAAVAPVTRPDQISLAACAHAMHRGTVVERVQATLAIQEFMHAPARLSRKFRAQLREFVTTGDMPSSATMAAYIDKFLITAGETDLGWREIFTVHDEAVAGAQLNRSGYRVLNMTSGMTFDERVPGESLKYRNMSAGEQFVLYKMFGGGVAIDRVFWDDQDYLMIEDILKAARDAYYSSQAAAMYALIVANAGSTVSTGADLTEKINKACSAVIRASFGKGVGAGGNPELVILHPIEEKARVQAAIQILTDVATQTSASKTKLVFRVKPVSTVNLAANAGIHVVLPGGQIKAGIRMDLTLFGNFNPANYTDDISGFGRYAGSVGNTGQIVKIT